ncbi:MAG: hypothetical protein OEZ59_04050 [Deltaproteobacteria bacterium]|nr:hypothetical protein [Deltaproteobacteria bacterium]
MSLKVMKKQLEREAEFIRARGTDMTRAEAEAQRLMIRRKTEAWTAAGGKPEDNPLAGVLEEKPARSKKKQDS